MVGVSVLGVDGAGEGAVDAMAGNVVCGDGDVPVADAALLEIGEVAVGDIEVGYGHNGLGAVGMGADGDVCGQV